MSLLGKYRKESEKEEREAGSDTSTKVREEEETQESIPNKERKSPIVSFSIDANLRECLQAIRKAKAINLSMWVEKKLKVAVFNEFPQIAEQFLESS
ncbi:hypothetical protein EU538_04220 [Candidatus Thorarchaeota archaeon]|jgi:hypothetical protein|nr:MAG: hypothetical protein EU538_04220 [Candidatus Thorarchaeota archaeon]